LAPLDIPHKSHKQCVPRGETNLIRDPAVLRLVNAFWGMAVGHCTFSTSDTTILTAPLACQLLAWCAHGVVYTPDGGVGGTTVSLVSSL